jgi:hypothetical protein
LRATSLAAPLRAHACGVDQLLHLRRLGADERGEFLWRARRSTRALREQRRPQFGAAQQLAEIAIQPGDHVERRTRRRERRRTAARLRLGVCHELGQVGGWQRRVRDQDRW